MKQIKNLKSILLLINLGVLICYQNAFSFDFANLFRDKKNDEFQEKIGELKRKYFSNLEIKNHDISYLECAKSSLEELYNECIDVSGTHDICNKIPVSISVKINNNINSNRESEVIVYSDRILIKIEATTSYCISAKKITQAQRAELERIIENKSKVVSDLEVKRNEVQYTLDQNSQVKSL